MKNRLSICLAGLISFFVLGKINAQEIDSFRVKSYYYRFSIPKDWVVESKQDSIQSGNNWNLILCHAVNTKKQNGRILVSISRIQKESTPDKQTGKSKKINTKEITLSGRKVIQSSYEKPARDCYDCQKAFSTFYYDPIWPNWVLCIGLTGNADQTLMNNYFKKTLNNFQSDFYIRNDSLINNWINSIIQRMVIRVDSITNSEKIIKDLELSNDNHIILIKSFSSYNSIQKALSTGQVPELKTEITNGVQYKYYIGQPPRNQASGYYMFYIVRDSRSYKAPYYIFSFSKPVNADLNMLLYQDLFVMLIDKFARLNNMVTTE